MNLKDKLLCVLTLLVSTGVFWLTKGLEVFADHRMACILVSVAIALAIVLGIGRLLRPKSRPQINP